MWFSESIEQTLKELQVDQLTGLSDAEANLRLVKFGPNEFESRKRKTILQLFAAQLMNTLIYVLFGAVAITLFMGEYVDSVIILVVITINAALGVAQEVKAGNALAALRKLFSPKAVVRRDGKTIEIASAQLAPGDILVIDAGRVIAADCRLIETANLQIDESTLTGESVPVKKEAGKNITNPETSLGDQLNMAFMSTMVTYGRGLGVVVDTGMKTEVGKIADIIGKEEESRTPLEKKLDELGKMLGKIAVGICVAIFVLSLIQGRNIAEMFLMSVSLAVAAIPEGLTAIVAVVLSIGVTSMSKRNAIIKKLTAVETLGSVNIVCSDKTGTLTQNKMTVTRYFSLSEGEVEVTPGSNQQHSDNATLLATAMILCSDATLDNGAGTGDPTEIALLTFGDALGIDRKQLGNQTKRMGERPFDSNRKLMSTIEDDGSGMKVYTKGAIDNLINQCTQVVDNGRTVSLTAAHKGKFIEATGKMSGMALRTLAAAYKPVDQLIGAGEMEKDLILVGMVGMIDPPRKEVKIAIEKAKNAGIATIMITGDHPDTAFAIAAELGIADRPDQAITGTQIDAFSEQEFIKAISRFRVFARVSPQHKVKIVRALKSRGNIVSMTGDGVNDAPSLQAADIGVAMGITGTDVAKNAADMILTDDNFATIINAIELGRNIYSNIKKSVIFLLASNLGEVIAMVAAILIGLPAPLIATQLLWINLLTDTLPAVALGMDPGDPDVMQRAPRDPRQGFFAHRSGIRVIEGGLLIGGLTIFAFCYGYYHYGYSPYDQSIPAEVTKYARTMAFMTIVCCQLLYALTFRHHEKSIFQIGIFSNRYLTGAIILGLALQLLVLGVPFMQEAFKLKMLDTSGWLTAAILGCIPVFVNEIVKISIRRKKNKTVPANHPVID